MSVSVILACLNGAETLGEALDGLVAQQASFDWEIILADNGSSDQSQAIFGDYAQHHSQIPMRVIDASAHRGKAYALNIAIRHAVGDRLLFCDVDDAVAPGWLMAMAHALDRHDLVAARLEFARLNPPEVRATRFGGRDKQKELGTIDFAPYCIHAGGATLGLHRRVFEDVGEFDTRFRTNEDTDWCIRAYLKGYKIAFVPEAVYHYRFRASPEIIRRQAYQYARDRALLRKLYAGVSPRGPREMLAWASALSHATGLMIGERVRRLRSNRDQVAAGRRAWTVGDVLGDLAGARAHGVPPRSRGFGPLPRGLKNCLRSARLPMARGPRPVLFSVRTDAKALALTFDDGPDPATTPVLLDLLARLGAKATFFLVGTRAERHPELVARIAAEGHEIGNHSWQHLSLPSLSEAEVADQLIRTRNVLQRHGRTLMRPPFGDATPTTMAVVHRLNYTIVAWNVVGQDWFDDDADTIARRILDQARPGSIVLLHDSLYYYLAEAYLDRSAVFAAVEQVVRALPDWRFVTVSELFPLGRPVTGDWRKTSAKSFLTSLHCVEPEDIVRLESREVFGNEPSGVNPCCT